MIVVARHTETADGKKIGEEGRGLYLVDPKQKGITISKLNMVDSRNYSDIVFDKVEINKEDQLGEMEAGGVIEEVLERGQIGISAEMLGNALEAFDKTLDYLKERNQFGKPIGSFQSL